MGLSIHYKGRFIQDEKLENLIDEVQDIAKNYDWHYTIFEYSFDKFFYETKINELFGILLSPPNCEPVQFTFDKNRDMVNLEFMLLFKEDENDFGFKKSLFTKTQYAGIEIHKKIIHIFKYISEKYLDDFEMTDEGHYWETNDEKVLQNQFDIYTKFTDMIELGLQSIPLLEDETIEEYVVRVVKKIEEN